MKTFKNFINESKNLNENISDDDLSRAITIKITPDKIKIRENDSELLSFDVVMSNGDKISYDSFSTTSPNPEDAKKNYAKLKINGKDFKMDNNEMDDSYYGVASAYERYLSK